MAVGCVLLYTDRKMLGPSAHVVCWLFKLYCNVAAIFILLDG